MAYKGLSGCRLSFGDVVVRKVSGSVDYNGRLLAQAHKQSFFWALGFRVPEVLSSGVGEDGLAFFEMERVGGVPLLEAIPSLCREELLSVAGQIVEFLGRLRSYEVGEVDLSAAVSAKCSSLGVTPLPVPSSLLVGSPCHGDFTLDNMLWDGEGVWFVDLLDSFEDHYFLDVAALFQDLQLQFFRLQGKGVGGKEREYKEALTLIGEVVVANTPSLYLQYHYPLLYLKMARILPYADEELGGKVRALMDYCSRGAGL